MTDKFWIMSDYENAMIFAKINSNYLLLLLITILKKYIKHTKLTHFSVIFI